MQFVTNTKFCTICLSIESGLSKCPGIYCALERQLGTGPLCLQALTGGLKCFQGPEIPKTGIAYN